MRMVRPLPSIPEQVKSKNSLDLSRLDAARAERYAQAILAQVRAAGIPPLYSPWLTNDRARNQPSMYDIWLQEVERYLAVSVEQRAEQDRQSRVNAIANAEKARRDDLVKQALWERWNKQQPFEQFQPMLRDAQG
jgi:hypothetical protein